MEAGQRSLVSVLSSKTGGIIVGIIKSFAAAVLCCGAVSLWAQDADSTKLNDGCDSLSYVIGRDVGEQLQKFAADIHIDAFTRGINSGINGLSSIISESATDSIRMDFIQKMQRRQMEEQQNSKSENLKESEAFLSQNSQKRGVLTTASGLQYKVVKKGRGANPTQNDSALVYYKAMLSDGTVIDAAAPDSPVTFGLGGIIPGLSEGIRLMNKGARYVIYIPPSLAYGDQGFPPAIPPNCVLIFEIELVEFKS
ncbi:MAG: FKBP-type peptidyl-prolyl cis-trans isomerase [Chitinispirillales bacterium]|jgi:FKBP-type peptidyl-prolyl cis-trans isomerase|nr:FKBP-type peptidyl-prolyl cis-trans isomerase [Chitinispirillales bacterium]